MTLSADAIRFSDYGGPEVLTLDRIDLRPPGKGEIQIRHAAIGMNFIDIYHRKGVFAPKLPLPFLCELIKEFDDPVDPEPFGLTDLPERDGAG